MIAHYRITPTFEVEIKDGELIWLEGSNLRFNKWKLSNKGIFQLSLKKPTRRRSTSANAYYWSCVVPIVQDYVGEEDAEEIHNLLKSQFLRTKVVIKGKEYTKIGRTSTLTTAQFADYLERVMLWGGRELGLVFPDADKEWMVHEQIKEGQFA